MRKPAPWARIGDLIHSIALGAGALVLLVMAGIMIAGVVMRYLFNNPIAGVTELVGSGLMVALIYLSLSSAEHIRVTIVVNRLPAAVRRWVERGVIAVSVVVLSIGVYTGWVKAISSYRAGEATEGLVSVAIYPYRFLIVLGLLLTALRALQLGRRWLRGSQDEPAAAVAPRAGDVASGDEQVHVEDGG